LHIKIQVFENTDYLRQSETENDLSADKFCIGRRKKYFH